MLTDAAARKAKPREKDYKLSDSGGLHLFVARSGHRSWRLKYRFGGKEKRIVFGAYPEVSLAEARQLRDDARKLLRDGRDPNSERKKAKLVRQVQHELTFEKLAREWHAHQADRWKTVHSNDVIFSLERDVFPVLGEFPLSEIDEALVLSTLRKVEARGAIETARRLRQRISAVFEYALGKGVATRNPTSVTAALKKVPTGKRWPALVDLAAIRELISTVDSAGANPVTRLASRFMALTAQRPGMIRTAPWSEFEAIDWADQRAAAPVALWRIPADRMKQELELREDDVFEHVVPLSKQAVEVLRTVRRLTGQGPLAFPNNRNSFQPLSENAVGYLYNRLGYKGTHVPHGWRSAFSTLVNEHYVKQHAEADPRLIIERLIVDLMLAHVPSGLSHTELRYNRAAYMGRRREIAQMWADWLMVGQRSADELLVGPRRTPSKTR